MDSSLGCAFFDYAYDGKKAPRCESDYGLPVHVDASIHAVFNVGNLAPAHFKAQGHHEARGQGGHGVRHAPPC